MSFIDEYYIRPIMEGSGYNIVNTLTYAILLIVAVLLTYKLLKKINIAIDKRFFIGILPFIALGGVLRALEDLHEAQGALKNIFLITPLIYVIIFIIALSTLLMASIIEKKSRIAYHKIWFVSGLVIIVLALTQMHITNSWGIALMILLACIWALLLLAAKLIAQKRFPRINAFLSFENISLLLIHLFDASTTYVAIEFYPYFEQHVVTGFFISSLGTASIFLLKFIIVSVVLYVFDRELARESEQRTFLKIVVAILGLGPGIRNFLRLMMGV